MSAVATRPSAAVLVGVELRKTVDTRAGFWLLLSIAGLTAVVAVLAAVFGQARDHTLVGVLSLVVQPAAVLLPIVGVLLVTSEWSQRTAMTTFALVPQRGRVLAAKLAAGLVLALVALVLCFVLSVLATAVAAGGAADTWSLPAGMIGQHVVYMATGMVTGVAVGAALLASAPAIVLYFVLPMAWLALDSLVGALEGVARWLDASRAVAPMTDELMSPTQWAHAATALTLWMLLPLAIGVWRVLRGEIK